jgi:hypothetical protein
MNQMKNIFFTSVFIFSITSCSNNENTFIAKTLDSNNSKVIKQEDSIIAKQPTYVVDSNKKLLITENMLDIDLIYQIVWNKEKHTNKVDSLVKKLLKCGIRDSLIIDDYINKLAATQTPEAYCFIFICCCQFYNIKHVTPFQSFVEILRKYGKPYVALNKYYLDNSILVSQSSEAFANQVISECYKNLPECYYINQ